MLMRNDGQPILASSAGRYYEALPAHQLRAHFQCIWTNMLVADRARPVAVVPDGCVDLLWRDGRFVVAGPDVTAANPILSPGQTVVGVRFQPGAAAEWLGLPLTEIVGREVAMTEFWGREAHRFADMITDASTAGRQAFVLQKLLVDKAPAFAPPPPEASAIFQLLSASTQEESSKVASLCDRLDTSERTLRRWSCSFFGYGPKTLDRILRLQKFRAAAATNATDGLAGLAYRAGYADQAHLSRGPSPVRDDSGRLRAPAHRLNGRFIQDHIAPTT